MPPQWCPLSHTFFVTSIRMISASSIGCSWIRLNSLYACVPCAINPTSLAVGSSPSRLVVDPLLFLVSAPPWTLLSPIVLGRRPKIGVEKILSLERIEDRLPVEELVARLPSIPVIDAREDEDPDDTVAARLENDAAAAVVPAPVAVVVVVVVVVVAVVVVVVAVAAVVGVITVGILIVAHKTRARTSRYLIL
ncbi:hypothetical protein B0O80DRAFT_425835 [Mortierella sp. GBAus27b]|nr:hypothetical protein B0O80DRAFT_425835 [Mortierella sp. GBAus27b]